MGETGAYAASSSAADAWVHQVVRGWADAKLTPTDRALCSYAVRVTRRESTRTDIERLREAGLDDVAIHDATQVIAYFNYITRIADSLGVEPESFIEPWGRDEGA